MYDKEKLQKIHTDSLTLSIAPLNRIGGPGNDTND